MINLTKTLDIATTPRDAILLDTLDGFYHFDAPQGRVELNSGFCPCGNRDNHPIAPEACAPLLAR